MNSKSFSILAGVTVVLLVAAIYSVLSQPSLTTIPTDRDRAFPQLADKLNDAQSMSIVSSKAKFTVAQSGDAWGIVEKSGYPVKFEKVKGAMVALSELKLLEAKTSDPARYKRLDVDEPDSLESKARRVVIKDKAGNVIASGVVGKRNPNLFGEGGGGTYLRIGEDAKSWLAEGEVEIGAEPNDWLIRDIANLLEEDVKRAVLTQPDGSKIVIHRNDKKDKDFTVDDVPDDRKINQGDANGLAGGLWRLTFEDVKKADEIEFSGSPYTAEYETFDGLVVKVVMTMVDDVVWGRFSAAVAPTIDDAKKKEVAEKAEVINKRSTGWVYELSAGEGEKLTTKMEDILEKPKES